jgi:hypothetical protein
MNPDPKNDLLKELLSNHELGDLRATTLDRGLYVLRCRRRFRRAARATGLVASVVFLAAVSLWFRFEPQPFTHNKPLTHDIQSPTAKLATTALPGVAPELPAVRLLSDDELLGLFPGRPVALIGSPGKQQLVFLDQRR